MDERLVEPCSPDVGLVAFSGGTTESEEGVAGVGFTSAKKRYTNIRRRSAWMLGGETQVCRHHT